MAFFHRAGSARPFEARPPAGLLRCADGRLAVDEGHPDYARCLKQAQARAQHLPRLFEAEFQGLFGYLFGLRSLALRLQAFRAEAQHRACPALGAPRLALYLAAAVSDFYLPRAAMSEHKMQSRELAAQGGLQLCLSPTPKLL